MYLSFVTLHTYLNALVKKRGYIALLSLLLLLQAGGVFLLQVEQLMVKWSMHCMLRETEADTEELVLSPEEYKLCSRGVNEVLYKGEMYDVKEKSCRDGMVLLHVLVDTRETEILEEIVSMVGHEGDEKDEHKDDAMLLLLSLVYILPPTHELGWVAAEEEQDFNLFCLSILCHLQDIVSPPPELV